MYTHDTIAAVATPPGNGGVGIIRISGSHALSLGKKLFRGKRQDLKSAYMYYGDFVDTDEKTVDSGYLVWFQAPRSFTGEDVIELHCHGGMVILQILLSSLFALGARPADPGEFSKRAFLNGKIDLVQAEAISDMICAHSTRGVEIARNQFQGKLSREIQSVRDALANVLAWMEAEIDYPEAEIEPLAEVRTVVREQIQRLQALVETYQQGKIYRDGVSTVILGKPNVGKSSLLNALVGEEKAIVTELPGTTRDVVEALVNIRGIPLRLADTAGIRSSMDAIEQIGVERAKKLAHEAQLIILVLDISQPMTSEDSALLKTANKNTTVVVLNKADLPAIISPEQIVEEGFAHVQVLSVHQGNGLEELKDTVESMFVRGGIRDDNFVSNLRHYQSVKDAVDILSRAEFQWQQLPLDLIALEIREAWHLLGEVTGAVWSENLLDDIFQRFCLGK